MLNYRTICIQISLIQFHLQGSKLLKGYSFSLREVAEKIYCRSTHFFGLKFSKVGIGLKKMEKKLIKTCAAILVTFPSEKH